MLKSQKTPNTLLGELLGFYQEYFQKKIPIL